jgi:hypothetical protein
MREVLSAASSIPRSAFRIPRSDRGASGTIRAVSQGTTGKLSPGCAAGNLSLTGDVNHWGKIISATSRGLVPCADTVDDYRAAIARTRMR